MRLAPDQIRCRILRPGSGTLEPNSARNISRNPSIARRGLNRARGAARQTLERLELPGADALLGSRGTEAQDSEELSAGDDRQGYSNPGVKRMREQHARIAVPGRLELL